MCYNNSTMACSPWTIAAYKATQISIIILREHIDTESRSYSHYQWLKDFIGERMAMLVRLDISSGLFNKEAAKEAGRRDPDIKRKADTEWRTKIYSEIRAFTGSEKNQLCMLFEKTIQKVIDMLMAKEPISDKTVQEAYNVVLEQIIFLKMAFSEMREMEREEMEREIGH